MNRALLAFYKLPILISITLTVVLCAVRVVRNPVDIALIALGTLLGMLLLDVEFFIYAYLLEPATPFAQDIRAFVLHKDFAGALLYVNHNKNLIREKSLNSAFFQIILAFAVVFIASTAQILLLKALVLSLFLNSIYKLIQAYYAKDIDDWFWALKSKPSGHNLAIYILVLLAAFVYSVTVF